MNLRTCCPGICIHNNLAFKNEFVKYFLYIPAVTSFISKIVWRIRSENYAKTLPHSNYPSKKSKASRKITQTSLCQATISALRNVNDPSLVVSYTYLSARVRFTSIAQPTRTLSPLYASPKVLRARGNPVESVYIRYIPIYRSHYALFSLSHSLA